jgi:hypothetical protein
MHDLRVPKMRLLDRKTKTALIDSGNKKLLKNHSQTKMMFIQKSIENNQTQCHGKVEHVEPKSLDLKI